MSEGSLVFDRVASEYDATRGGLRRGGEFARVFAGRLPPGASRVLEVGVGTGAVARPLTDEGFDVVGVDLSTAMLARAHERLGARVGRADAAALPVATGTCDAVLLVWVLHVVGDPGGVLGECARVLRPGGRALVVPADPDEEPDEITDAVQPLRDALGRAGRGATWVRAEMESGGWRIVEDAPSLDHGYDESPAERADLLERRTFSWCWDLDEAEYDTRVRPVVEALRALPDPERRRPRRLAHRLIVAEPPTAH